jgi:hypothetical protein
MLRIGAVALSVIGKGGGSFTGEGRVPVLRPDQGRIGKRDCGKSGIKMYKGFVDAALGQGRFVGALKVTD